MGFLTPGVSPILIWISFDDSANCNLTAESSVVTDAAGDNTWVCWTVSEMVDYEYGLGDSVSLVLNTLDTGNADFFYSKEYTADTSLIPYLNITYHAINQAPSVTIDNPEAMLYTSGDVDLNFSVVDADDNLDSCWYTLDAGVTNTTLASCANTTLSIEDDSYTLVVYANDSFGLEASESVSFEVDATGVAIGVDEPTGTKDTRAGIALEYSATGESLTCWYSVETSIGGEVIANTTLEDCNNTTFDVASDGDYVAMVYVNNTYGSIASDSSSFSVDTSTGGDTGGGGGGGGGSSGGTIISVSKGLELSDISNFIVNPGEVKTLSVSAENTGAAFLNGCNLVGKGDFVSWISSEEVKNLAAGEKYDFLFDLGVPEEVEEGAYEIVVSVDCDGLSKDINFSVEIIEERLGFNVLKVVRIERETVQVVYSLEELSGIDQNVELQFLLFDSGQEKVAEMKEEKGVTAGSMEEFEVIIPIDSGLEGELNFLVNLNSETYSTFVQENIFLGAPISGFAIFGGSSVTDRAVSLGLIVAFLVFAFFIVRKILHRKKKSK